MTGKGSHATSVGYLLGQINLGWPDVICRCVPLLQCSLWLSILPVRSFLAGIVMTGRGCSLADRRCILAAVGQRQTVCWLIALTVRRKYKLQTPKTTPTISSHPHPLPSHLTLLVIPFLSLHLCTYIHAHVFSHTVSSLPSQTFSSLLPSSSHVLSSSDFRSSSSSSSSFSPLFPHRLIPTWLKVRTMSFFFSRMILEFYRLSILLTANAFATSLLPFFFADPMTFLF